VHMNQKVVVPICINVNPPLVAPPIDGCRISICGRSVAAGARYCTQYHGNLQAVYQWGQHHPEGHICREIADEFLALNCARLGGGDRAGKNPLQPRWRLTTRLPPDATASLGAFLRFAEASLLPLLASMPHKQRVAEEQRQRAEHLADLVVAKGARVVRLMDGYGRVVLQLLLSLHARGALRPDFRVEVLDIDEAVTAFHRALYGGGEGRGLLLGGLITATTQDITAEQPDSDTLVYMNFCGMAAAEHNVSDFLTRYAAHGNGSVVISFSTARRAAGALGGRIADFNRRLGPRFKCQKFTPAVVRKDFVTYDIIATDI
jgi:hypothetical protein